MDSSITKLEFGFDGPSERLTPLDIFGAQIRDPFNPSVAYLNVARRILGRLNWASVQCP